MRDADVTTFVQAQEKKSEHAGFMTLLRERCPHNQERGSGRQVLPVMPVCFQFTTFFHLVIQHACPREKGAKKADAFFTGNGSSHQTHITRYLPSCYHKTYQN